MPGWEQEKKLGESAIIRKLFGEVWNFIRTHRYCLLALYFIVYIVTFFIIEEHTPTEGYWVTDTFIDDYIPSCQSLRCSISSGTRSLPPWASRR